MKQTGTDSLTEKIVSSFIWKQQQQKTIKTPHLTYKM